MKTTLPLDGSPTAKDSLQHASDSQGHDGPYQCKWRRPILTPDGNLKWMPCGRPRCSLHCRWRWARMMVSCLIRSFRVLPPTHAGRVSSDLNDKSFDASKRKLARRLSERKIHYFMVNEWSNGNRHIHLALRIDPGVAVPDLGALWKQAHPICAGPTHSMKEMRDPVGFAHYLFKFNCAHKSPEMPPKDFKGLNYSASKGFLAKPRKQLWLEQIEEWYPTPQSRPEGDFRQDVTCLTEVDDSSAVISLESP